MEETITSNNEVLIDSESDMPVGIWNLGNSNWMAVKSNVIAKWKAGS